MTIKIFWILIFNVKFSLKNNFKYFVWSGITSRKTSFEQLFAFTRETFKERESIFWHFAEFESLVSSLEILVLHIIFSFYVIDHEKGMSFFCLREN